MASVPETADPARFGLDPRRLDRIRGWMARYVEAGKLPGALTLVARQGTVVWCDCVGHRDVERGLAWERGTLARIYSMTKPVTATALMMLWEEGLCHLDDPLDLFLPEFADPVVLRADAQSVDDVEPARERPTLRHLLTHTSGFTYGFQEGLLAEAYRREGVDFSVPGASLEAMVGRLAGLPLGFQPGSRWNYGVSTDVLGRVVEVISGQTLGAFFRERILGPLGMDDTSFAVPEAKLDRLASLYRWAPEGRMELAEDGPGSRYREGAVQMFSGGGGLVSTVDDYLRFAEMQRRGGVLGDARILGPRTVALMASNHLPGDLASMGPKVWAEVSFEGVGFGLMGWVMLDPARAQVVGSPGDYGWGGLASTVYWVDPREDMVVVFLTQLAPSSSHPIRKELRALVYSALTD